MGTGWRLCPMRCVGSGEGRIYYDVERRAGRHGHWWGERPEGVAETIRQAQAQGLAVMLKPQVWFRPGWAGDFTPGD